MGIATPPIAGGSAVVFAVLFAQMGIPAEAMAIALSFDILTDFLTTAFEMYTLPLCLAEIAAEVNMLDRDVLKSE